VPQLIVHFHFDQHIAGIEHALTGHFLAVPQFDNFFSRDEELADLVIEAKRLGAAAQRVGYFLLES
jgi:hypothetical protein